MQSPVSWNRRFPLGEICQISQFMSTVSFINLLNLVRFPKRKSVGLGERRRKGKLALSHVQSHCHNTSCGIIFWQLCFQHLINPVAAASWKSAWKFSGVSNTWVILMLLKGKAITLVNLIHGIHYGRLVLNKWWIIDNSFNHFPRSTFISTLRP